MDGPAASASPSPSPRRWQASRLFFAVVLTVLLANLLVSFQATSLVPKSLAMQYVAGPTGAGRPKIAIVTISGTIDEEGSAHAIQQVRQAAGDESVHAVVLRIDSPGGTVSASDRTWREINVRLRGANKPIVVSMGDYAASGGYYVAAPANHVMAEPTTLTGSIGVIIQFPQIAGTLEKIGAQMETIASGPAKDSGSMYRAMSPDERERWRKVIDEAQARFVRVVAQGRGMTIARARALADGGLFTAQEAVDNGLVDEIGYLDDALRHAQRLAKLEEVQVVRYNRPTALLDGLLDRLGIVAPKSPLERGAPEAPRALMMMR